MRWITRIIVNNYRAFAGPYLPIDIEPGQHVLIYGENGSGKSSLYTGLKDFLQSSDKFINLQTNRFDTSTAPKGSISIDLARLDAHHKRISKIDTTYLYSETDDGGNRFSEIQMANKLKGFLDYRRLLQTHLIDSPPGTNPNLFGLIVEDLLADHNIHPPTGGVRQIRLGDEWLRLQADLLADRRTAPFKQAVVQLTALSGMLEPLLKTVIGEAQRMLNTYFRLKVQLDVQYALNFNRGAGVIVKDLYLKVTYAGQEIVGYQQFLNEARLSALAVCVYLASIKTRPLSGPSGASGTNDTLKILFLDDVFIGLDTGNRIPLLEILKYEFIQSEYQVFISTYDRYWFELARFWFKTEKCMVKSIELFADDSDNDPNIPDHPIVVDPSLSSLEHARAYFRLRDYPAAANWARKSCESELNRILPSHLLLKVDQNTGEVRRISTLETLVDHFNQYALLNQLNLTPFIHFKTYKKVLLNPLSHDDLETPRYGREVRDAIALAEELQHIQTQDLVFAKDVENRPLKLGARDKTTSQIHLYEIRPLENLRAIKQGASSVQLGIVPCEVTEGGSKRICRSLQEAYAQIRRERGYPASDDYSDCLQLTKVSNKKRLLDLIQL